MTAWQTLVARLLAWLLVLPGLGCFWFAARAWQESDDFLLFVMPLVISAALGAGLYLTVGSVLLAVQLQHGDPGARLKALVCGLVLAMVGLLTASVLPLQGLLTTAYGGLLAYCVGSSAAARDLGSWRSQAPGGRGLWR